MLSPQQLATRLLEGTLSAEKASTQNFDASVNDRQQFIDSIIDRCDLLNPGDPEQGSATTHYVRGMDVLVELLTLPRASGSTRIVNPIHGKIFDHQSPGLPQKEMSAASKLGMIKLYVGLQAKSPEAAIRFLMYGLSANRTKRIFGELCLHIDKPLIMDAAVGSGRIDALYNKSKWSECLPHLTNTGRDAYFGGDLGL